MAISPRKSEISPDSTNKNRQKLGFNADLTNENWDFT
jgi:hypothetical protein